MSPSFVARFMCLSMVFQADCIASANDAESVHRAASFSWWNELGIADLNESRINLANGWVVLAFLDPDCPISNTYIPVLNSLSDQFAGRQVSLVGVYTDPVLEPKRLRNHVRDFSIRFPLVRDGDGRLVHLAGASYSSEVAVLDGSGTVLYRGRIDNRVAEDGRMRPKATENDLRIVLQQLLSGDPGPFPERKGFGCFLPESIHPK